MPQRKYTFPSINSLVAFEAVARLRGFARAAEELNTSQPAVSRHIRNLEVRFGVELVRRDQSPISLTPKGSLLYTGVVQGFDTLQSAIQNLQQVDNRVTLVCTHSVSHLLLMPRYGRLRQALGKNVELRVMTAEYDLVQAAIETGADIFFEYSSNAPDDQNVVVCEEVVKPVGTPHIVQQAINALSGNGAPPPLLGLQKDNYGWMDWPDWKKAHPEFSGWQVTEDYDSYVYLLEGAAAGLGLGMGWRGFVDSYLDRGDLMEMPTDWHSKGTKIHARLTRFGRNNPAAQKCLELLENLRGI